jgi:putative oxidoreductase
MQRDDETLILPALGPAYAALRPYAWPLIRIVAGANLMPHGAQKLFGWFGGKGMEATAAFFASSGFEPPMLWVWLVALTEFVGGLCLAVGLLTRPAALAIAIFLFTAVAHHWPNGFFWTQAGFEYPLLWGSVALAFVIRGAGALSLDRLIGRSV